jgi:hypothetical protein
MQLPSPAGRRGGDEVKRGVEGRRRGELKTQQAARNYTQEINRVVTESGESSTSRNYFDKKYLIIMGHCSILFEKAGFIHVPCLDFLTPWRSGSL